MHLADLTIVLPTRNEAPNIGTFLSSIPPEVQLVIVDSSSDSTRTVIAQTRPRNTVVLHRRATIAEARQIGAEAASTPWLLFTDADVRFAPGYFERLGMAPDGPAVIYGAKSSSADFVRYYRWFVVGQKVFHALGIPAATGSNLLIRRDALLSAGGFDPALVCNEDTEIVWRIQRQGGRVDFDPELVVYETDHRRLRLGALRKTMHSLTRCLLLYLDLMPSRWRASDWKYWANLPDRGGAATPDSHSPAGITHS